MPTVTFRNSQEMIAWASSQAETLLSPLGDRWLHVQGVARQAQCISCILNPNDRPYLIAAAYLHDIGYAPPLLKTHFHPLDGAYYLRDQGLEQLASLVAHHSEAQFEAELRGFSSELEQFPHEHSLVADALTYCDLTTSPTGKKVPFKERITDITSRYKESDIVAQALHKALPTWQHAIQHIQQLINQNTPDME